MSKERERAYARRRYAKRVERQVRAAKVRRERNIVAGVLAGVIVVGLVLALVLTRGQDAEPPTAAPSDTAADSPQESSPAAEGDPLPTTDPQTYEAPPPASDSLDTDWDVVLHTSVGDIGMTLDGQAAPQAVASMTFLAGRGFFDGTACHRLLPDSLLQCGDPTATGTGGPGYAFGPIENAPEDDIYPAGTVAMARAGGDGESMGSQFFLVFGDVPLPADDAGGYTVMGSITSGLDLLEQVGQQGTIDGSADGRPAQDVIIESVEVTND